ncbi:phage minor head protein [Lysinibacillus telephonicus]|uniref:phage head morphogenesis protein n=1 Tax=Lysinibacillus telephonicus TaxID=1714840 RepID=UPI0031FCBB58
MAKRKVPDTRFPDTVAVTYNRAIKKMVNELGKETLLLFDQYIAPGIVVDRQDGQEYLVDGQFDNINKMLRSLKNKASKVFSTTQIENAVRRFLKTLNNFNKNNISQQAKVVGINPTQSEPWLKTFMEEKIEDNVGYITKIQEDYLNEVEEIVQEGIKKGSEAKQIRKQLVERIGMTERRAQFIAVDQTGSILGQMTAKRHQEMGVLKFKWRTSKDERVRESHRDLSNKVFSYDNPPTVNGRKVIPGEDYHCRCVAIPIFY